MGESGESERISQRQGPKESLPVPKEYFDAYIEGNLFLPNRDLGIATFIAEVAVSDPTFTPRTFAKMQWSKDQFDTVKERMNIAHTARHIPAATPDQLPHTIETIKTAHGVDMNVVDISNSIPEGKIRELWPREQYATARLLGVLAGLPDGNRGIFGKLPFASCLRLITPSLSRRLSDPEVFNHVRDVIISFAETLRSKEGQDLAREVRETMDNRIQGIPLKKSGSLRRDMEEPLIHGLRYQMLNGYATRYGKPLDPEIVRNLDGVIF